MSLSASRIRAWASWLSAARGSIKRLRKKCRRRPVGRRSPARTPLRSPSRRAIVYLLLLVAAFETSLGSFTAEIFLDQMPITAGNFLFATNGGQTLQKPDLTAADMDAADARAAMISAAARSWSMSSRSARDSVPSRARSGASGSPTCARPTARRSRTDDGLRLEAILAFLAGLPDDEPWAGIDWETDPEWATTLKPGWQAERRAKAFTERVDAAAVYVNASTRFTDGFEYGMGAEIGNSTQKLHARGPIGLCELTTYKYVVRGDGQVRG